MRIWIILPIIVLIISLIAWSFYQNSQVEITKEKTVEVTRDSPTVISIEGFYMDEVEISRIDDKDMAELPHIDGRKITNYGNEFDEMLKPFSNGRISLKICLNEEGGIQDIKYSHKHSTWSHNGELEAFMKYFKKVAKFEAAETDNCGILTFEIENL